MKIMFVGKNTGEIENLVRRLNFQIVSANPNLIISYGGDGTLLSCERKYPGIPKLPIRNSKICKKCPKHEEKVLLKTLLEKNLPLQEYVKLETTIENQTITALNDFVIRNKEAVHAIRFQIPPINSKLLIGDGIILSTPWGSTGYFKSITQQTFFKGFGLAFNNTIEKIDPIIFKANEEVTFKLIRGHGGLTYDNSHSHYAIKEGSELNFKLSSQKAKIYEASSLRCPNCQVIRG